jgi:hypothetical protein
MLQLAESGIMNGSRFHRIDFLGKRMLLRIAFYSFLHRSMKFLEFNEPSDVLSELWLAFGFLTNYLYNYILISSLISINLNSIRTGVVCWEAKHLNELSKVAG